MFEKNTLCKEDITHKNGFPANIDLDEKIIVQIIEKPTQPVVLYISKYTKKHSRCFLDTSLSDRYNHGLYEL